MLVSTKSLFRPPILEWCICGYMYMRYMQAKTWHMGGISAYGICIATAVALAWYASHIMESNSDVPHPNK